MTGENKQNQTLKIIALLLQFALNCHLSFLSAEQSTSMCGIGMDCPPHAWEFIIIYYDVACFDCVFFP